MQVRLIRIPERDVLVYEGEDGDTYEDALQALDFNPDTVLIFHNGKSLPQDKKIEEDEVEIFRTCSRG